MTKKLFDSTVNPPRVVLVLLSMRSQQREETTMHWQELEALACTGGMQVEKAFVQYLKQPHLDTLIGYGKVQEINDFIREHAIDKVIFDDDLSPAQVRNLEKAWNCTVWDRSLLILHIFAIHARTAQAKTQVALARYQYLLPRLRGMWRHFSRQRGGLGLKGGAGEKELETDRRLVQGKMRILKQRLLRIEKIKKTQRKQRKKWVNVSLVGYTNAGKSALMRSLSKADVLIKDQLFATLSPVVRKVVLKKTPFLLSDTVGFIRKLPPTLVACFKSTLVEVCEADVLLHVIDASNPHYISHIEVVHTVLKEIGAGDVPKLLVLNKQDKVLLQKKSSKAAKDNKEGLAFLKKERARLSALYECPVVYCSALEKESMEALRVLLHKEVAKRHYERYPYILEKEIANEAP